MSFFKDFLYPNKVKITLSLFLSVVLFIIFFMIPFGSETGLDEVESKILKDVKVSCEQIETKAVCESADFITNTTLLKEPDGRPDCQWFNNECRTTFAVGAVLIALIPFSGISLIILFVVSYILSAFIIKFKRRRKIHTSS